MCRIRSASLCVVGQHQSGEMCQMRGCLTRQMQRRLHYVRTNVLPTCSRRNQYLPALGNPMQASSSCEQFVRGHLSEVVLWPTSQRSSPPVRSTRFGTNAYGRGGNILQAPALVASMSYNCIPSSRCLFTAAGLRLRSMTAGQISCSHETHSSQSERAERAVSGPLRSRVCLRDHTRATS